MVFGRNLCEKRQTWLSEPHFGKLGVTHDLGWWLLGKPMFLFALHELVSLSIAVPELWGEMCTGRLFSQGRPICTETLPAHIDVPINHSWHQQIRDTGLSDGEDRNLLRSLVLTQYRSVTDRRADGRTDRRISRSIYSACKASFAKRCKTLSKTSM